MSRKRRIGGSVEKRPQSEGQPDDATAAEPGGQRGGQDQGAAFFRTCIAAGSLGWDTIRQSGPLPIVSAGWCGRFFIKGTVISSMATAPIPRLSRSGPNG